MGPVELSPFHMDPTDQVTPLGHPFRLDAKGEIYEQIYNTVTEELNKMHRKPMPTHLRVKYANMVVFPRILYWLECLPYHPELMQSLQEGIKKYVLGVEGCRKGLVDKTIYSPKKFGIGLTSIIIALANRILDTTDKEITKFPPLQYLMPPTYIAMYFRSATEFLGADTFPMPHIDVF